MIKGEKMKWHLTFLDAVSDGQPQKCKVVLEPVGIEGGERSGLQGDDVWPEEIRPCTLCRI